jgi:hypothetical protein
VADQLTDRIAEVLWDQWVPSTVVYGTEQPVGFETVRDWAEYAAEAVVAVLGARLNENLTGLSGIADAIREDIKRARAEGDDERRQYLRGELQGILQAFDLVSSWVGALGEEPK